MLAEVLDDHYLAISALVTIGMQLFFFFIAYLFQIDKVTDISGSMNFVLLAWLTFLLNGSYDGRKIVILCLVSVWGLRLGSFLLYRVLKRGHDARFDEMRAKFWNFLGFWVFQMFWVFVVSLPVIFLMSSRTDPEINAADIVGWLVWLIGFLFETVADQTKSAFNDRPENKTKWLATGVWYPTRHPNYFGEIMVWIGIMIVCSAGFDTDYAYFAVLSPILTFVLLMLLSGVPLAEERFDRRYGNQPEYWRYKHSTAPLLPFPPSLYYRLPRAIKYIFCCEYGMYWKVDEDSFALAAGARADARYAAPPSPTHVARSASPSSAEP